MASNTGEQVARVLAVLHGMALGTHAADELASRGQIVGARGWAFDIRDEDTTIKAKAQRVRQTEQEAFEDALRLRDALLEAAGAKDARGHVAASAANDGNLAVRGWIGAVELVLASDR